SGCRARKSSRNFWMVSQGMAPSGFPTVTVRSPFAETTVNRWPSAASRVIPRAAAYADRVVFLADGKIVDELREPTADSVLDRMKRLDAPQAVVNVEAGA
ncbi:MAG: hypothetical protein ABS976_24680, partial [Rhodococcus sp. (in: high G+C Gram-positive bacteria)]